MASRVQRVMFSHTPNLSRERLPRTLLIDRRLRFFVFARDSDGPRHGIISGELTTGAPRSEDNEPLRADRLELKEPAVDAEYADPKEKMDEPEEVE